MNVSVVIPSSLREHPAGGYWWERAVHSALAQTVKPAEVWVAVDPDIPSLPTTKIPELAGRYYCVAGDVKGHQSASNAGVKAAESPCVAFLEDDDSWEPWHLEQCLTLMREHRVDLVTNSQRLVDPNGHVALREHGGKVGDVFHFPTASGWVVNRLAFLKLGGFDPRFKIHHDNDFLGRWGTKRRLHVLPEGEREHPWVTHLNNFTALGHLDRAPSVKRTVHEAQVMARKDGRSGQELAALEVLFGGVPW